MIEESLVQQVAALSFQNVPEYRIAEELKITRYRVRKIRSSEEFKQHIKTLGEEAMTLALNSFRSKVEKLEPLAFEALEHNLKEKKLDAVRVFGDIIGIKNKDGGNQDEQQGPLVVLLPGQKKKEIEVNSEAKCIDLEELQEND